MGISKKLLVVVPVAAGILYLFSCLLIARSHYQSGLNLYDRKEYAAARTDFENGLSALRKPGGFMPALLVANDLQRINRSLGDTYFKQAAQSADLKSFHREMAQAENSYRQAATINPYDVAATIGLARATAALEKVAPRLSLADSYNALPVFHKALQLRPQGLEIHFLLIRYLHAKRMSRELEKTAAHLVEIYPQSYHTLKKEPFYDFQLQEAIEQSLHKALTVAVHARPAYSALARIEEEKGNLQQATQYHRKSLDVDPRQNSAGHYTQLGRLLLKSAQKSQALEAFAVALKLENDREKVLDSIWAVCRGENQDGVFLQFCEKYLEGSKTGDLEEILKARSLIELEQYQLAIFHLLKIPRGSKHLAESYHLRTRIAEKNKDWDEMELNSHQASVLEPANSNYQLMFSRALKQKKKYPQAEAAATRAINASVKPTPWLYNHRAWIRWQRNDITGATADWEESIRLKPDDPAFYYYMALAHERLKNKDAAILALHQALKRKPDDSQYLEKLKKLKGNAGI